jgi:hypothetical protein
MGFQIDQYGVRRPRILQEIFFTGRSKVLRWGRAGVRATALHCFIALDPFRANRKMVLVSHR